MSHYRVSATNAYGTTYGADETFRTAAGSRCPAGAPCPLVSPQVALGRVSETHSRWREGSKGPRRAPPTGTTFSFKLDAPAAVRFTFTQPRLGRWVKHRCQAPTTRDRHDRSCQRAVVIGTLTVSGHVDTNRVHFAGHVAHHRLLPPGRYTALIQASNTAGRSRVRTVGFTIVHG